MLKSDGINELLYPSRVHGTQHGDVAGQYLVPYNNSDSLNVGFVVLVRIILTNPRMIAKGIFCALLAGISAETRAAEVEAGFWDIWSDWANCTELCGPGSRNRTRECVDETGSGESELLQQGEHVDLQCVGGDVNNTDTEACQIAFCPEWATWESWGVCSVTCATGTQARARTCMEGPEVSANQTACPGDNSEAQDCNTKNCPTWGEWDEWTTCDAECNGGLQHRSRDCTDAAKHRTYFQTMMLKLMGREDLICDGIDMQSQACNEQDCDSPCGDINTASFYSALGVGVRSNMECKSNTFCNLVCIDASQVPVVTHQQVWDGKIDCVGTDWVLHASLQSYVCQDLACNYVVDFDDGVVSTDVEAVCMENNCALNCTNAAFFPQPAADINCGNYNETKPFIDERGISCTESQCGDVGWSAWMTAGISTRFTSECDAVNCTFSCADATMVPSVSNQLWDGLVACDGTDWNGDDVASAQCRTLPCVPFFGAGNVTATEGAALSCTGGSCAVTCSDSQYPSPAAIDCDNYMSATEATCTELSCGDITTIEGTLTLGAGLSTTCDSAADVCTFVCADNTLTPFPIAEVTCDDASTQNPVAGTSIKCADTSCGDAQDFNYGTGWGDVTTSCNSGGCNLTCAVFRKAFVYPVTEVTCADSVLTPVAGTEIICAETPCGSLDDTYSVLDVTSTCDAEGCTFTCNDTAKMASYASVECSGTDYVHAHGSDSNAISCITKQDTPCGDVSSTFTYTAEDVTITCAAFDSVFQTTSTTCGVVCADATKVLDGDATLTCENNAFTNTNTGLACKDTACGDLSEKWTVEAGVSYTCDNAGLCSFTCDTVGEVSNAATVQCTAGTFEDLVLFNGQLTNPTISCAAPADTYCGDTSQFTVVPANTTFACDADTQVCNVICDQAVYGSEVQSSPSTVTCDVNTRTFVEALDTAFECQLYDVSCGNLVDNYNIGSGINSNCVKFNSKRSNLDVCSLTCNDTSLYPTVTDTINCDIDTLQFVEANDTAITCETTKCGNPDGWNFGADYAAMTKTCDMKDTGNMDCLMTCSVGTEAGFVLDADGNNFETVTCGADRVLFPAAGAVALSCAETPCGKLSSNVNIDAATVTATCDASGCTFTCADEGTMPSYAGLACAADDTYTHMDGSDTNAIACVTEIETPCGDVADAFTYEAADINLNCNAFNSVYQTSAMNCTPTCVDATKILIGDSTITCENTAFTNANKALACKSTTCGDVSDKFTVAAGVSHTCDTATGVCSFTCDTPGELPLVNEVTCNAATSLFDDVILWPTTANPVTNPTIICEVRDEVPCGNAADFTNVGAGTVITCDYAASSCALSCDASVPTHSQPNIDVINCNPITKVFDQALVTELNCELYDVTCGDIDASFTIMPGVITDCTYYEARNQKLDICALSCNDTTLVPSPITEIVCDQETEQFLTTVGQTVKCIPPPETSCGYISDAFIVDASAGVATCDGNNCWFTCADPLDFAAISEVTCTANGYFPNGGTISCLSGFDTACGNLDVTGNSVKNCTDNVCEFDCAPGKFLHGVTQATCTVVNGTKTITNVANLHVGETSSTVSVCGDTMCGDLTNLGVDIDAAVIVNATLLGATGYGSIQLDCPTSDKVISGLKGQSAVACLPNGNFDVVDPAATIACSETTCGNVADVLDVEDVVVGSCDQDTCTFSCNIPDADTVDPTLSQLICQTGSGKFLTGAHTHVKCIVGCQDFGPESGFLLDGRIHMECNADQYCDLICRPKGRPIKYVLPTVRETGQSLTKLVCNKLLGNTDGLSDGRWQSVVYTPYGIPVFTPIQGVGVRHVVCDEDLEVEVEEEEECVDVRKSYDIMEKNMMIRCTPEACIFLCEQGYRLADNAPGMATCKIRHSDQWTPIYKKEIRCIEETVTIDTGTSSCDPIDVVKEATVSQKCNGDICSFSCTDGGDPSVSEISCDKGKWQIPKDIKKKGIRCTGADSGGDEEAGCGEFTAFEDGVVPNCAGDSCTFDCVDEALTANVKKAKCVSKKGKTKWDLGKKGPKKVACTDGADGGDAAGCGDASFDDTVAAECDAKSCTFTCVDTTLMPNSLTATCSKKNKWTYDDKKVSTVSCSPADEGGDGGPTHKCDMEAFPGVLLDQCSDAKVSTCTASCTEEGMTPDSATVDCKKGKWSLEAIVCA